MGAAPGQRRPGPDRRNRSCACATGSPEWATTAGTAPVRPPPGRPPWPGRSRRRNRHGHRRRAGSPPAWTIRAQPFAASFFTPDTSAPVSSTTPRNSCPIRLPSVVAGIDRYGHRSLPQMHERSTRTTRRLVRSASGRARSPRARRRRRTSRITQRRYRRHQPTDQGRRPDRVRVSQPRQPTPPSTVPLHSAITPDNQCRGGHSPSTLKSP